MDLYDVFLGGMKPMLLDDPTGADGGYRFAQGRVAHGLPPDLVARVQTPGERRPILWTVQLVPIVIDAVAEVVESVTPGAVQWIPVSVEGYPDEPRQIMNVIHKVDTDDATDLDRSVTSTWSEGTRKAGQVMVITRRLRQDLEPDHDIFRLHPSCDLIMTGRLKAELDGRGLDGATYTQVA
jgi:hypothetical protein